MNEEPERKDVASKHGEIYVRTAPLLLGDIHRFLFKEIEKFLIGSDKDSRNLLVVGHGPTMLPFSNFPERVSDMLGEKGRIVLIDYNEKTIESAKAHLKESGFLKRSGLKINEKKVTNPKSLEARTITFNSGNIKNELPFENDSFNGLDITLTGHHATPFLSDLDRLTLELYRILDRKSMVHYGEGSVYMDSESIINDLGSNTADFFHCPVLFVDERDKEFIKFGLFENGKIYVRFPERKNPEFARVELILDEHGNVTFTANNPQEAQNYIKFLRTKKRVKVDQIGNIISIPLIDENVKEIKSHFIDPIHGFYQNLFNKIEKHFAHDPSFRNKANSKVIQERDDAEKGLVEYYKSIKLIRNSMKVSQFKDFKRKMYEGSTFGSIIARKA